MRRVTWPIVGVAAAAGATFLGAVALTPADQPELRSALIGVLVTAGGAGIARYLGARVDEANNRLDEVGEKVNGRMSQLLDRLAAAERRAARAEQALQGDVSRETSHPPTRARKKRR